MNGGDLLEQEDVFETLSCLLKNSEHLSLPQELALLRIHCIRERGFGVTSVFAPCSEGGVVRLFSSWKNARRISQECLDDLKKILQIHLMVSSNDPTLSEELGRAGTHVPLGRLLQFDVNEVPDEETRDSVMDLQDLASEIASIGPFPLRISPFSLDELKERLPLEFDIVPAGHEKSWHRFLVHQVTMRQSEQKDVGFVMWPSAVVLARWLASNRAVVCCKSVLELGAGCGLTGLVAAQIQKETDDAAGSVFLSDFNRTVLDNLQHNIRLNDVSCQVVGLDFYQQSGTSTKGWKGMGNEVEWNEPVDVVLAADIICQPEDAVAAANTFHDALKPGGRGFCVCADAAHRFGVDRLEHECSRVGLTVRVEDSVEDGVLQDNDGLHLTSGYVKGMRLSMFFIEKPAVWLTTVTSFGLQTTD